MKANNKPGARDAVRGTSSSKMLVARPSWLAPSMTFQLLHLFLILVILFASTPLPTNAAISGCSASVSPSSLNTNQGATLSFQVTNNDGSNSINWVRFTAPSNNFQITSGSSSGWGRTIDSSQVITFSGGGIAVSGSTTFNVNVQTGLSGVAAANWGVQVSDDNGSGSTSCSGDTSVEIVGDSVAPAISSISATSITQTEATITWNTNEPATSRVRYGTTTSYGSTATNNTLKTSHSITLTGLSAGTTYHYRVDSTDEAGNAASSGDNVFTTAQPGMSLTISNVSVTNIATSQATVTWTTNMAANSRVEYGTTSSYGNQVSDGANVTGHSLTLTGLSADTTYHYKITSQDTAGNSKSTSNNTFTTAKSASSGGGGSSGGEDNESNTSSGTQATPVPTKAPSQPSSGAGTSGGGGAPSSGDSSGGGDSSSEPAPFVPADITAPNVVLTTDFSLPYAVPPVLEGTASDNRNIASVSYSRDGGSNWLPVTGVQGLFTSNARFSIGLPSLPDENYAIQVRVFDAAGNVGLSPVYTLVIDQIPPVVGTGLYAVGAQSLSASSISSVIAGLDQRVTVSAIGGATGIDIVARRQGSDEEQVFSLVKNADTGLWTGTVSLEDLGEYELIARAVDGANNKTERTLRELAAVRGGQVLHDNESVPGAQVTVQVFDTIAGEFSVWDAEPFRQQNPQITNERGEFQVLLPPGTYYVDVTVEGYRSAQTPIFTLDRNTPIQLVISLSKQSYVPLGPLKIPFPPLFWKETVPLAVHESAELVADADPAIAVVGTELPDITLEGEQGTVSLAELAEGAAVISLIAEWSPYTAEQLAQLHELHKHAPGQVAAILVQGTHQQASLLKDRGRYDVPIFADVRGDVAAMLGVDTTPANLIISPDGIVSDIRYAVRSHQELAGALLEAGTSHEVRGASSFYYSWLAARPSHLLY